MRTPAEISTRPVPAIARRQSTARRLRPHSFCEEESTVHGRFLLTERGFVPWRSAVMASAIRLRSAVALLGRFPALAGVDLDVESGEVVLVQGPNGAGKTSLLRACAGLLAVVEGEAVVLGHDLRRDRRAVRRRVGLLGHAGSLYDDLTVADNVRFAVRAARGDEAKADDARALLGLDGRLRHV